MCWHQSEKKTADTGDPPPAEERPKELLGFLAKGGQPQTRYERLRAYALLDPARRPQVSPERFDLQRFRRFGLLGLVDEQPIRQADDRFDVHVVPLGTDDAMDRWARLSELLAGLVMQPEGEGGEDATSCSVRAGVDGTAGEGEDDPEPACRDHALR